MKSKQRRNLWAFLAIAGVIAAGSWIAFDQSTPPVTANVDYNAPAVISQGEAIFDQYCTACHGPKGRGEIPGQPMGGQKSGGGYIAPALNRGGHAWHHGPAQLFSVIKEGSPARDSSMRGMGDLLSDEEIHSVIAYIRSLWPAQLKARYDGSFSEQMKRLMH